MQHGPRDEHAVQLESVGCGERRRAEAGPGRNSREGVPRLDHVCGRSGGQAHRHRRTHRRRPPASGQMQHRARDQQPVEVQTVGRGQRGRTHPGARRDAGQRVAGLDDIAARAGRRGGGRPTRADVIGVVVAIAGSARRLGARSCRSRGGDARLLRRNLETRPGDQLSGRRQPVCDGQLGDGQPVRRGDRGQRLARRDDVDEVGGSRRRDREDHAGQYR